MEEVRLVRRKRVDIHRLLFQLLGSVSLSLSELRRLGVFLLEEIIFLGELVALYESTCGFALQEIRLAAVVPAKQKTKINK